MPTTDPQILFRAAAGPRMGYGHLVRATVLGQALGLPVRLSIRGTAPATKVARRLGWSLVTGGADAAMKTTSPSLLVIDDPTAASSRPWRRAATRRGIPVASVHDLGLGACAADLTIDGSVVHPGGATTRPALLGPRYLVLAHTSAAWQEPPAPDVLIALGGGQRNPAAIELARRLRAARPDVRVRIAGGLTAEAPADLPDGVVWLGPRNGLAADLASATVAIVGGGLSLYDACRIGTPAVGVAVVPAQRPTIEGLAARHAAVDGGSIDDPRRVVRQAIGLLDDVPRRARMSRLGRRLVDGQGASRVALRLHRLMGRLPAGSGRKTA